MNRLFVVFSIALFLTGGILVWSGNATGELATYVLAALYLLGSLLTLDHAKRLGR